MLPEPSARIGTFGVSAVFYDVVRRSGLEIWAVDQYVNELLLLLSVIGAPIILGALLFYGITITERRHHSDRDDNPSNKVAIGGKRRQR